MMWSVGEAGHLAHPPCTREEDGVLLQFGRANSGRDAASEIAPGAVPGRGPHPFNQRLQLHRPGEIIVGPCVQAVLTVSGHCQARNGDDGGRRDPPVFVLPQLGNGFEPAHARHPDVHQNHVGHCPLDQRQGSGPASSLEYREPCRVKNVDG